MDRPRHEELIAKVRKAGAAVQLITDGDVAGVIATTDPATGIDIYIGQGGAPEGVLAAAALRCVGGQMQARLVFKKDDEKRRAERIGIKDFNRKYTMTDLVSGDVVFSATGVTDGSMLRGVHRDGDYVTTESVVMRSATGTVRWIKARHRRNMSEALGRRRGFRRRALLFGPALAAGRRATRRWRGNCGRTLMLSPVLARLLAARGVSVAEARRLSSIPP